MSQPGSSTHSQLPRNGNVVPPNHKDAGKCDSPVYPERSREPNLFLYHKHMFGKGIVIRNIGLGVRWTWFKPRSTQLK